MNTRFNPIWLLLLLAPMLLGAAKAARSDGGVRQYTNRPAEWFGTPEAATVAANLLSHQSDLGGWPKNTDTSAKLFTGDRTKLKPTRRPVLWGR